MSTTVSFDLYGENYEQIAARARRILNDFAGSTSGWTINIDVIPEIIRQDGEIDSWRADVQARTQDAPPMKEPS